MKALVPELRAALQSQVNERLFDPLDNIRPFVYSTFSES